MKSISIAVAATSIACASAFTKPPAPQTARLGTELNEYIPSGFTKESWAKFKTKEAKTKASQKNLGRMGPKGFQSRSFQSFQEALERGETSHLMPVMNAKERVRKGELKVEDIPYMQRGGNWDNSDVKGAKKIGWLKSDKEYADGGYKKSQSVSIFGEGAGLDWTGKREKAGPMRQVSKNYQPPTVGQLKGQKAAEKPKKRFGLF